MIAANAFSENRKSIIGPVAREFRDRVGEP